MGRRERRKKQGMEWREGGRERLLEEERERWVVAKGEGGRKFREGRKGDGKCV